MGTATRGSTMTRKVVVRLAAVALAAGVFVSEARAAGKCNPHICSAEIATACAGLNGKHPKKGKLFHRCKKAVVAICKTNPDCSCDGSVPVPCTPTTTTSSTTTSTTARSTTTSTTTSSTTPTTTTSPLCGNGVLDPGEQCDGSNFGSFTCPSPGGALLCTSDCKIDFSECPS